MAQILVQSNLQLVSSVLVLGAAEPVPEPVTQMAVEPMNDHLSTAKEMSVTTTSF